MLGARRARAEGDRARRQLARDYHANVCAVRAGKASTACIAKASSARKPRLERRLKTRMLPPVRPANYSVTNGAARKTLLPLRPMQIIGRSR